MSIGLVVPPPCVAEIVTSERLIDQKDMCCSKKTFQDTSHAFGMLFDHVQGFFKQFMDTSLDTKSMQAFCKEEIETNESCVAKQVALMHLLGCIWNSATHMLPLS